jgi:hypothetical protein
MPTNRGLITRGPSRSFAGELGSVVSGHTADDFVREVNENIAELGERFGLHEETLELICECGDPCCDERVTVPAEEYERLHATGRRFVAPTHVRSHVAERHASYAVV